MSLLDIIKIGSQGWDRTNDTKINSFVLLPTELLGNTKKPDLLCNNAGSYQALLFA